MTNIDKDKKHEKIAERVIQNTEKLKKMDLFLQQIAHTREDQFCILFMLLSQIIAQNEGLFNSLNEDDYDKKSHEATEKMTQNFKNMFNNMKEIIFHLKENNA